MPLVIKLGGHLFSTDGLNVELMERLCGVIRETHSGSDRWVIVVGGGEAARRYIEAARRLGADETTCDEVAIQVTRIHASIFTHALSGLAYPLVPTNLQELREALSASPIAVTGGFWPGQSTFAVASLCAQAVRADRMIVATNVAGVYDSDPRTNPSARLIPKMSYEELKSMISGGSQMAGEYRLADSVGLSVLERSKKKLIFIDGRDPENLRTAITKGIGGTIVTP